MSEFLYEVGDEFEGSPILASRFISEVQAVGGVIEIDGSLVRIVYLPASVHGKEQVLDRYEDEVKSEDKEVVSSTSEQVEAEEKVALVAETIETVKEVVEEVLDAVQEELEPGTVEESAIEEVEEAPKPARKGRPRKVSTEE